MRLQFDAAAAIGNLPVGLWASVHQPHGQSTLSIGSAGSLTRWWKTGSALDCKSPTRAHTAVGGQHTDQVDAAAALRNLFTSFGD